MGCTDSEFYATEWGDCLDDNPDESSGICDLFPLGTATLSWLTDAWPARMTSWHASSQVTSTAMASA